MAVNADLNYVIICYKGDIFLKTCTQRSSVTMTQGVNADDRATTGCHSGYTVSVSAHTEH